MRSVHDLRMHGWFVGDGVSVADRVIDHVLVGPAGVLAVQVRSSLDRDCATRADVEARIAARRLQHVLAVNEVAVEVVPAVLACGPGQPATPGGVRVVDGVALLFEDHAEDWLGQLRCRELLDQRSVERARDVVASMLEQAAAAA
ncbi:MAG TPA: hypothetical protein VFV35_04585 [Acidimicrobiales bacterium]|nr:hypothetical protein [Acidimicrobiales bacterium]